MVRETRPELGADEYPQAECDGPPDSVVERSGHNVYQRAGQRHYRQGKVRCGRGNMHGEMEHVGHGRHMDNATTNAQEARKIAHSYTQAYPHTAVIGERVERSVCLTHLACDIMGFLLLCLGGKRRLPA